MVLNLPVIAPTCCTIFGRHPVWEKAWKDGGVPGSFDSRFPYLHLPYLGGDMGNRYSDRCVTRVFWNRRQYKAALYKRRIKSVDLAQHKSGEWCWAVTVADARADHVRCDQ